MSEAEQLLLASSSAADKQQYYFGEVFHPAGYSDDLTAKSLRLRSAANFHRFVDEEMATDLRLGPPTSEWIDARWQSYRNYLQNLAGSRTPIIDIKYGAWSNLSPIWNDPLAAPHFLGLVARSQASIIHLRRQNVLAQALSAAVADKRGRWHRPVGSRIDTPVFTVDVEQLSSIMLRSNTVDQ